MEKKDYFLKVNACSQHASACLFKSLDFRQPCHFPSFPILFFLCCVFCNPTMFFPKRRKLGEFGKKCYLSRKRVGVAVSASELELLLHLDVERRDLGITKDEERFPMKFKLNSCILHYTYVYLHVWCNLLVVNFTKRRKKSFFMKKKLE